MSKIGKLLIATLGMGLLATCHQSIFTGAPGSVLQALIANPTSIPANGGVSVITAVIYDGTGQPVPDGTVVQFFTTLGRVDPQGRTNDGVTHVNLQADGRSGEALVTAIIGEGAAPAPVPSPTASPKGSTTIGVSTAGDGPGSDATTLRVAAATGAENTVTVKIGTLLPKRILLAADPRNIARDAPRFSTVTATVIDEDGNPIANIPVVFAFDTTDRTQIDPFEETLESRGLPLYTDNNGQARDRVFTARDRAAPVKTFTITAEPVVGAALTQLPTVKIGVNY